MRDNQGIIFEIVRLYIEKIMTKINTAERSLVKTLKQESLILAQDKRWRRT